MTTELNQARELLATGGYTCVLRKEGRTYTSTHRGVAPLLGWLEDGTDLTGFSAADKVVGRAAALLYRLLRVREVYAAVISRGALEVLEAGGISVIHDTTMHDAENFNYAYVHSAATVQKYLEKYPSIRYVLDIHRDSIFNPDGSCEKTLTYIDGKPTAQIMPVVGTNQNGSAHPNWKTNLTVAAHLEDLLGRFYPTLSRPINLRADGFNQWLSDGALIIEVGSCGNTLEEAKRAGELFATTFAVLLKENHVNTIS